MSRRARSAASALRSAERLCSRVDKELETIKHQLVGRLAVVKHGKYRGRDAVVTGVCIEQGYDHQLHVQARPIGVRNPLELLYEHPDARTFWPVSCVHIREECAHLTILKENNIQCASRMTVS